MAKKRSYRPRPAPGPVIPDRENGRIVNPPRYPEIGGMTPEAVKRNDLVVERPGKEQ